MQSIVLLVEDDPILQLLGSKQLEMLGLPYEIARNGQEAIEKSKQGFKLILMDLAMPDMSGIQATLSIREQELRAQRKRVPIVAMTAYAEKEAALLAGMDGYIQKPVLLGNLKQICERWLFTKEMTPPVKSSEVACPDLI